MQNLPIKNSRLELSLTIVDTAIPCMTNSILHYRILLLTSLSYRYFRCHAKVPVYGKVSNLTFNSVKFLETLFNPREIDFELEGHLCSELSLFKTCKY